MTRRAKIVCTMGPATSSEEGIAALLDAGMNVARMNFSHGDYADHEVIYHRLRAAAKSADKALAILADLQGPKIRLGRFTDGPHDWNTGDQVTITVDDVVGTRDRVSTTYKGLAQDARPGDRLLIDDGKVGLVVTQVDGNDVMCSVTEGGPVSNNKGISLPGMNVSVPAMSREGHRRPEVRAVAGRRRHRAVLRPVARRCRPGARSVMDEVGAAAAAGHRQAREAGSGGQSRGHRAGVRRDHGRPRRSRRRAAAGAGAAGAEAGRADRPGERPAGDRRHPDARLDDRALPADQGRGLRRGQRGAGRRRRGDAVRRDLGRQVPDHRGQDHGQDHRGGRGRVGDGAAADPHPADHAAACCPSRPGTSASGSDAKALVAFTYTGDTVRRLARLHTTLPVLAFTPRDEVRNQLSLTWGVRTFVTPPVDTTDAMVEQVDQAMLEIPGYEAGRHRGHRGRRAAEHLGLDQPDPGAPARSRRLTTWLGVDAATVPA